MYVPVDVGAMSVVDIGHLRCGNTQAANTVE